MLQKLSRYFKMAALIAATALLHITLTANTSDATVVLRPPKNLSLDQCIEFIAEDELLEITPQNIRLRKKELDVNRRRSQKKRK